MKKVFVYIIVLLSITGAISAQEMAFVPVYSVTGTIADHPSSPANGNKIVLYRTDAELHSGIYAYDVVGPTGATATSNLYLINVTDQPSFWSLTPGQKFKVATVRNSAGYGAGPVEVTISGSGYDVADLSMTLGGGVTEVPEMAVAQPPIIKVIRFGNRVYFKHLVEKGEKFYTSATPKISAVIEGVGTSGINRDNITLSVNEGTPKAKQYTISSANIAQTTYAAGTTDVIRSLTVEYNIPASDPLPEGQDSKITLRAWSADNTASTVEVCTVSVLGGPLRVIGPVLPYPSPFSPTRDGKTEIQYTLSRDANIDVYLVNIAGEMVRKIYCPAGSEGGSAGTNKVVWNGRNEAGEVVGNGVYAGTIISRDDKKMLAKFKVSVFD